MKNLRLLFVMITTINIGCSSVNNKFSEDTRKQILHGGKVAFYLIHKNAKVGDYCIVNDGNLTNLEIKIDKIEDNKFYISEHNIIEDKSLPEALRLKFKSKYYREIVANSDGTVIDSFLTNEETLQRDNLVAQSSHVVGVSDDNFNVYTIKTKAGDFKSRLHYRIIKNENSEYYQITFSSDEVNFNLVKSFFLSKKDYEIFKLLSIEEKENFKFDNYIIVFKQGNKS